MLDDQGVEFAEEMESFKETKDKRFFTSYQTRTCFFPLAFSSEIAKQVTPIFLLFYSSFNIVVTLVNSTQTRFVISWPKAQLNS